MRHSSFRGAVWVMVLVTALACSLGARETPIPATQEALEPTKTPLPKEEFSPTAEPPTPEPTTETPVPGTAVSFEGVSFVIPEGLASGATGELVPASADPEAAPEWDRNPAYTDIRLEGYQLEGTFHDARVTVYPVAEYVALNPGVQETVDRLESLIADPYQDMTPLPLLPVWNAGQMLHVQVAPVSFVGGQGIRYLAEYGQDLHPISNSGLFYTFQGLTDDGATYISVILPVSHPSLPADGSMTGEEYDAFVETFESYLAELTAQLDAKSPESFVPSLATLDALVQTIQVSGE